MSILELIKQKTDKDFNSVTKEDLLEIIESIENEKQELKRQKKYGLVWEEQKEDVEKELENNYPILKEVEDREIKTDGKKPTNLLIEGDNLHSLNTLLFTHKGKISQIILDPPYNTGNKDFIYNDKYIDREDTWRHSKWLSFMNKRLKIAKELLSDDGVIFINIDDNEQAQLKLLCDEVFGEENFIASFVWKCRSSMQYSSATISSQTEYIHLYSKKRDIWNTSRGKTFNKIKKPEDIYNYQNPDNDPNGPWITSGIIRNDGRKRYSFTNPNGKTYIESWLYSEENMNKLNNEGRLWFGINGDAKPRKKSYWKEYSGKVSSDLLMDEFEVNIIENKKRKIKSFEVGTTEMGTNQIKEILGKGKFDYPKPTKLIEYLIKLLPNKDATILDFFAGSGTTGHAVLALNEEDGGNRQFILCTNNENNICEEVTYQRLNKVINGYTTPKGKEVEGLGGNLKYYKTDFVSKDQDNYDIKIELADKCTELLCIKENCFDLKEQSKKDDYKIFESNEMVMAVYNDFIDYKVLNVIKETLLKSERKTKVIYLFDGNANMNEFEIVEIKEAGIEVKFIPKKIMQIYEEVLKIC